MVIATAETNKRYYWLKLKDDFFKQKEIKQLRKMAGGDTFTIIYLKMLLRSLRDNGRLYYEGIEQDFVSELALDLDEEVENVKLTVAYLMSKGILMQGNADEYELITVGEMAGSEGYSAERMRRLRSRKLLASQSDTYVTASDEEIDIEIEKREKSKSKKHTRKSFVPPTVDEIRAYADSIGYNLDAQFFFDYYNTAGWKRSDGKPVLNWKQTMQSWKKRDEGKQTQGRSKEWKNPALAYQQREYTDDMFGDDFYYNVIEEYGDKKKDKADDQYDGYIDLDKYGEG